MKNSILKYIEKTQILEYVLMPKVNVLRDIMRVLLVIIYKEHIKYLKTELNLN